MKILAKIIFLFISLFFGNLLLQARDFRATQYYYAIENNDTIMIALLPQIIIFPTMTFKNEQERIEYARLVRDVRKTIPYANTIVKGMMETYEFMETLPNNKAKERHLKETQKYMMDEFKPQMKKLTKRQGLILIKLIDRQTNSSAYEIVKAIAGSFKATYYNAFAGLLGNSLKTKYEPAGKDKDMERIIIELQQGSL